MPDLEKIICVCVNFPDRNTEYKDVQEAPLNMSLFIRFSRSFVGHETPLIPPPETPQLDYEGEIVIIIGKVAGVLNDPVTAVVWLVQRLAQYDLVILDALI